MIITELLRYILNTYFSPVEHFVYSAIIREQESDVADFWKNTFSAPYETTNERIYIREFVSDVLNSYNIAATYADCLAQEKSFFWDNDTQTIYVHFDHDASWYTADYSLGQVFGYTDSDVCYINDIEYLPLIKSVPNISKQVDLQNYSKLAFVSGSIVINNVEGLADWMISADIYGQSIYMMYLADSDIESGNASRDDLVDLAAFYIEDYDIGTQENIIRVQDIRKAQNIDIPVDVFSSSDYPNIQSEYVNEPIPLIYGDVAEVPAIPVNGDTSGDVTFRAAKVLTAIGQIQVFYDDTWNNVTATSTDLSTGSFTLAYADCRKDGATDGDIFDCRVQSVCGETITYASDVIKKLNEEALNLEYTDTNYDTVEWATEEKQLAEIGVMFQERVKLYEAIRQVQSGANIGFRYEIKANGRRTIRIDDTSRTVSDFAGKENIRNLANMNVETDSELLAAIAVVKYKKNYQSGHHHRYIDVSERETARKTYRQTPTLTAENNLLQTETLAAERASWMLDRFSTIPKIIQLELMGTDWYTLRIYDIIQAEITLGFVDLDAQTITGREFYGIWNAQVISVAPDFQGLTNRVRLLLTEKIV